MHRTLIPLALGLLLLPPAVAQEDSKPPVDSRLSKYRNIYDKMHPWTPPNSLEAWKKERERIRTPLLVSNGLHPMPPKAPLNAKLGKVFERDGYTVQHAMFASMPGHYVTGLVYRPKNADGKQPAVLCPHGHWANGRFYDAGESKAKEQLANGAESIPEAARCPLQARFVQLARMGCVVFHYDMVGYADSTSIEHRGGFNDAQALLWLNNKMGLQTWNSIRALDFVSELENVDKSRIAVTGASGGGTQTFMLAGIERDRIAAAFPAVMVSTNMQGGCVCENASYLRIGINNIAIAALFAPKPMAMSGADDWTIDIEKLGLPELRQIYSFYGKPSLVNAKAWPQFKHNYNSVARHFMYEWFNEHLSLGQEGEIKERGFKPLTRDELSVWSSIEKPTDIKTAAELRTDMRATAKKHFDALFEGTKEQVRTRYQTVVGGAFRVMVNPPEARPVSISTAISDDVVFSTVSMDMSNRGQHLIRYTYLRDREKTERPVNWLDDDQAALLNDPAFRELSDERGPVRLVSYFAQGMSAEQYEKTRGSLKNNQNYAGLTFCYNRPLLAERSGDLVTLLRQQQDENPPVTLVGTGNTGPAVLLAAAASGVKVDRVIVDLNGFSFTKVDSPADEMMLPGALRYGDIGGLAALALPCHMQLYGTRDIPKEALAPLLKMKSIVGGKVEFHKRPLTPEKVVELLK